MWELHKQNQDHQVDTTPSQSSLPLQTIPSLSLFPQPHVVEAKHYRDALKQRKKQNPEKPEARRAVRKSV